MNSKSISFRRAAHWGQMSKAQILDQMLLEGWSYPFCTFSEGKISRNANSPLRRSQAACRQLQLGLWWSGTELQKPTDLASSCRLLKIIYGLFFGFLRSVNGSCCLEKEEFSSQSQNWTRRTSQGPCLSPCGSAVTESHRHHNSSMTLETHFSTLNTFLLVADRAFSVLMKSVLSTVSSSESSLKRHIEHNISAGIIHLTTLSQFTGCLYVFSKLVENWCTFSGVIILIFDGSKFLAGIRSLTVFLGPPCSWELVTMIICEKYKLVTWSQ